MPLNQKQEIAAGFEMHPHSSEERSVCIVIEYGSLVSLGTQFNTEQWLEQQGL